MTTTVSIEEAQMTLKGLLARAREGDEILIEDDGEEVGKIIPVVKKPAIKQRQFGRGRPEGYFMSDDFNDELPDSFWGFDKEL